MKRRHTGQRPRGAIPTPSSAGGGRGGGGGDGSNEPRSTTPSAVPYHHSASLNATTAIERWSRSGNVNLKFENKKDTRHT
eukprot:31293-Pelagococcus_subviridis.AAC.13